MTHYKINKLISRTFLLFGLIFNLFAFSNSTLASKLNQPEVDRTPAGSRWWAGIWSPEATADEIYSYIEKNSRASNRWIILDFDGREVVVLWWKGYDTEVKSKEWLNNPLRTGYYTGPSPNDPLGNMKGIVEKIREKIKIEIVYIPNIAGNQNTPSTVSLSSASKPQSQSQNRDIDHTRLSLKKLFEKSPVKPDFQYIESTQVDLVKNGWLAVKCKETQETGISCFTNKNQVIEIHWAIAGGQIGEIKIYPFDYQSKPNQQSPKAIQTLTYSHGKYVGEVMNGKAHGYGTYTSAKSGTVYTGQFIADSFNGDGTMTWTNGSKFVGKWQNDIGISGTMTYSNGRTISGVVRTGVFTPSSAQSQSNSQPQSSRSQANTDVEIKYANGDFYLGKVKNGSPDGYGGRWFSSRGELVSTTWSNGQMVNGSEATLKYTSAEKRSLPQISGKIIDGKFVSLFTLDLRKKIISLNDQILKLEKQIPTNTGANQPFDLKKFNFDGLYDDNKLNDILSRLEGFRDLYQKELETSVQTQKLILNLKTLITMRRQEIDTLQKSALNLQLTNLPNDSTKNLNIDKINDVTNLSEILSEMNRTRDSLNMLFDKALSQSPTINVK